MTNPRMSPDQVARYVLGPDHIDYHPPLAGEEVAASSPSAGSRASAGDRQAQVGPPVKSSFGGLFVLMIIVGVSYFAWRTTFFSNGAAGASLAASCLWRQSEDCCAAREAASPFTLSVFSLVGMPGCPTPIRPRQGLTPTKPKSKSLN